MTARWNKDLTAAVIGRRPRSGSPFGFNLSDPPRRVEFTGPLGRRSAAQPLITSRHACRPHEPRTVYPYPLIHPFTDTLHATGARPLAR